MAKRREFSKATRVAAFERAGKKCEECRAPLYPGKYVYDHVLADGLTGEPTLENCAVVCTNCHGWKTRKHDIPAIAKAKRTQAKHVGATRKQPWGGKWRRKVSGEVVER